MKYISHALGLAFGLAACPTISLAGPVTPSSYSYLVSPSGSYPDSGNELLDGVIPTQGWGNSTMTTATAAPYVGWLRTTPQILFQFSGPVTIQSLTFYADDADGAAGVHFPTSATISMGGTTLSGLSIPNPPGSSPSSYTFSGLGLSGTSLQLNFAASPNWLMLSEVQFDNAVTGAASVPLPAIFPLLASGLLPLLWWRRKQIAGLFRPIARNNHAANALPVNFA